MQVQRQYALKQIFMKTEFENSIRRLSILCRLTDIGKLWNYEIFVFILRNNLRIFLFNKKVMFFSSDIQFLKF